MRYAWSGSIFVLCCSCRVSVSCVHSEVHSRGDYMDEAYSTVSSYRHDYFMGSREHLIFSPVLSHLVFLICVVMCVHLLLC